MRFVPKVWKESLREITHNSKINNVCVRTNLMKQYVYGLVVLWLYWTWLEGLRATAVYCQVSKFI